VKVDAPLARLRPVIAKPAAHVQVDATDLALLRLLAGDARISQRQLAQKLGISAPTVGDRMSRLERNGVIRRYGVEIDWDAIGYGLKVYLSVTTTGGFDIGVIMRRLWEIAEVEDLTLVAGRLDLIARLRVRDHAHLRAILLDQIWTIPGMAGTETLISMAEMPAKAFTAGLLDVMERPADGTREAAPGPRPGGGQAARPDRQELAR
jgi:Lrp/AsnC family transcriptional regulator for asnA, asnC and gidA